MSGVQMITVTEDDAGQRIDRWLRCLFPHVSQGRIEKMCRKGELRVEGGRVKASTRLEVGQVVRVPPLPDADHKPAEVRRSISLFAMIDGVDAGLQRLENDLRTGEWHQRYGDLLARESMDFGYRLITSTP